MEIHRTIRLLFNENNNNNIVVRTDYNASAFMKLQLFGLSDSLELHVRMPRTSYSKWLENESAIFKL